MAEWEGPWSASEVEEEVEVVASFRGFVLAVEVPH